MIPQSCTDRCSSGAVAVQPRGAARRCSRAHRLDLLAVLTLKPALGPGENRSEGTRPSHESLGIM